MKINPEGLGLDYIWSDHVEPEIASRLGRDLTADEIKRGRILFECAAYDRTEWAIDLMSGTNPLPTLAVVEWIVGDLIERANPPKRKDPRDEPGWVNATGNDPRKV